MPLPRLSLSVIGDEIGSSLDEMISFCGEHGVKRLDMRTVGGRNLLSMSVAEVGEISSRLDKAGITVPTFVSPLLKWTAPGRSAAGGKVDFAFDPAECPEPDPIAHAFDLAVALGAGRIRSFSYLRYDGYEPRDLQPECDRLLDLCVRWGIFVEIENEPVCNIGTIAESAQFFSLFDQPGKGLDDPWFRPLIDIANNYSMTGAAPAAEDIAVLAPLCDQLHFKDRKLAERKTVPMGDGDIPWADELKRVLSGVQVPEVLASLETHCFDDKRNATARSVAGIRRLAAEIGAEIV